MDKDVGHQVITSITDKRVGDGPVSDTASWLHGSDCLPAEGPIAGEGLQKAPGPVEDDSSIGANSGNHEC